MHLNYKTASWTLVHDVFLRNTQIESAEHACVAIIMSPWFSRGWTALELAASRKIRVIFKKGSGITLVDLDKILLHPRPGRHQFAVEVINGLRKPVDDLDQLLRIIIPRHTSWSRDRAIIADLLTRIDNCAPESQSLDVPADEDQHDIHRRLLHNLGSISYDHLFHNLPTNGSSWCPADLFQVPISESNTSGTLRITRDGDVFGKWKVLPIEYLFSRGHTWHNAHPVVRMELQSIISAAQAWNRANYRCLAEPLIEVRRLLIVKTVQSDEECGAYRLIGHVDLDESHELVEATYEEQPSTIINSELNTRGLSQEVLKEILETEKPALSILSPSETTFEDLDVDLQASAVDARNIPTWPRDRGRTTVSWAAGNGDIATLQQILDDLTLKLFSSYGSYHSHPSVDEVSEYFGFLCNSPDEHGMTALSWAAKNGQAEAVKLLLGRPEVNVDVQARNGWTPLWFAANNDEVTVVQLLLDFGARTDIKLDDGSSLYHAMAQWGSCARAVMGLFLNSGKLDVESKDLSGRTPLLWAVQSGREDTVKLLLELGKAGTDSKDQFGRSPLSWAAQSGSEDITKLLLDLGKADTNSKDSRGRTPLSWAAQKGHEQTAKTLLCFGQAQTNVKDSHGRTPLSWAAQMGHQEIAILLLGHAVTKPDLRDKDGRTPLSWAAQGGHEAVVKILLTTDGVNADAKDNHGRTPLFWAEKWGCKAVVEILLETNRVDANSKDNEGRAALPRATWAGTPWWRGWYETQQGR